MSELLKRSLVQKYKESDLYTIYYDVVENEFYRILFRKKPKISDVYMVVIVFIVLSSVLPIFSNTRSCVNDRIFGVRGC